ncbi:MAG: hypothetical protein NC548_34795 [Lachnospiraceae bacterium]|nr:hypothetical protein [Lachnospiraceae bacterium]
MFKPIQVSDVVLKWLQDNGIVGKEPYKPTLVNKEDIPQCVAKPPMFRTHYEKRYIVNPKTGEEIK